jgi:hypothetical protein
MIEIVIIKLGSDAFTALVWYPEFRVSGKRLKLRRENQRRDPAKKEEHLLIFLGIDSRVFHPLRFPCSGIRSQTGTVVKQRYMLSIMCGSCTYNLIREAIVALYRLSALGQSKYWIKIKNPRGIGGQA